MATEIKGDSDWSTDLATAIAIIVDEKANAALSGTATSGSWLTRTLNTIRHDPQSLASLASNEFTLQAGTYKIEWDAPFFVTNRAATRLYNVTDAAVAATGTCIFCSSGSSVAGISSGVTYLTLASAKDFRVEYQVETTAASNGLGVSTLAGFGEVETFTTVKIQKVKS